MKKEHPILFSTPMVEAILQGRKTMTRRVAKSAECKYRPGDKLWVREKHKLTFYKDPGKKCEDWTAHFVDGQAKTLYAKELPLVTLEKLRNKKLPSLKNWCPSIFLYKEFARIWLEITNVRVERLHDISSVDCVYEGACDTGCSTPKLAWEMLWKNVNGPKNWNANPWVWVIEFKQVNK